MINYKKIVEDQKRYVTSGNTMSIDYRIKKLSELKKEILNNLDNISLALEKDFKKAEFETYATEIMGVINEITYIIKNLKSWAKPKKVKTPIVFFKGKSRIYSEPYGSVLVITAWNYPFLLGISPLIGAISAGNSCVLKPSEIAKHTSSLLKSIIEKVFNKEHCIVIEGGVDETTELLKQNFDFIHYTGGEVVGKIVSRAAAENLTPIVLELGGKSPCIVDETTDITISARRIVWGKFVNAGQTCVAPDYLLVHKSIKDKFIDALKHQIKEFYGENIINSKDYCRIISEKHFNRLTFLIDGENIIFGGKYNRDELFIEPTLLDNVSLDSPVMNEEIFGPIFPILTYSNLSEVIDIVNSYNKPLALYYFSKDKANQDKIIKSISFGGGCINATVLHTGNHYLPFGGVGNSGMGSYHGKWSFETFSHKKSILSKSFAIDMKMQYPSYEGKIKSIKRFIK